MNEAIVRPVVDCHTPQLGPVALMVAAEPDFDHLRPCLALPDQRRLYMSRLFYDAADLSRPALIGPLMGAPYAVILLEMLHAWGVQKVIFLGWCGSINQSIRIGDLIIPDIAWIDEGTSGHYGQSKDHPVPSDVQLCHRLQAMLQQQCINFHSGAIWTIDAIFRETRAKVEAFQQRGVLAVEMELSALLSVAAFHHMAMAAVLAVSDELFTFKWRTGFNDSIFKRCRKTACDIVMNTIKTL